MVASSAVSRLAREGLVSDARFAEVLVRSRQARGYGPARVRRELAARGLSTGAIARIVDFAATEWLDVLRRVRRKKYGARPPATRADWARQARFLQGRGFTAEQIRQVLKDSPDESFP